MNRKEAYKTNAVIVIGFLILGFYFKNTWLYGISASVFFTSVLSFTAAKYIASTWMFIGKTFGNFNAKIILSIFFFFILLPMSLIKRIFTKERLEPINSTWQKTASLKAIDFNKQF